MTKYEVKVSDFIAYELGVSNEGLTPKDGKLFTGLLPLIESGFISGTYKFDVDGFKELLSWADYQADCNSQDWYGDEDERFGEFMSFLNQLKRLR